jgi:hypothetical protein
LSFPHFFCHSRAGGNPSWDLNTWIPAFAGMTNRGRGNDKQRAEW